MTQANEELDIDEVMRLTGKSKPTIMRWKREGKLTARTEMREFKQKQPRLVFLRSEVERLAGET